MCLFFLVSKTASECNAPLSFLFIHVLFIKKNKKKQKKPKKNTKNKKKHKKQKNKTKKTKNK